MDLPSSADALRFVGRERELSELRAGLGTALAGDGVLYLVAGEPGIGKTRLAGEFAHEAAATGARVCRGSSVKDGGAPPYWPWLQVLRHCVDECPPQLARTGTALRSALSAHLRDGEEVRSEPALPGEALPDRCSR